MKDQRRELKAMLAKSIIKKKQKEAMTAVIASFCFLYMSEFASIASNSRRCTFMVAVRGIASKSKRIALFK